MASQTSNNKLPLTVDTNGAATKLLTTLLSAAEAIPIQLLHYFTKKKKREKKFFFLKGNLAVDINRKFARRKEVQLSLEFGVVVKVERE